MCPIIAKKMLEEFGQDPRARPSGVPYDELTQRELQVLQLAANGLSNKELAGKLVISEKAVKNHTANIFSKLQVNDRTQAILYGLSASPRRTPTSSGVTAYGVPTASGGIASTHLSKKGIVSQAANSSA